MNSNPYLNASQDPDFLARNAKDQRQASPEAIERYRMSFSESQAKYGIPAETPDMLFYQSPQRQEYERAKPKFILTAVRSALELAALIGGLAAIVGVLIVLTAMA